MIAVNSCASSFIGVLINGVPKTAIYDTSYPTGKIRITNLGMNMATAEGAVITIQMKNTNPTCDTLQGLCQAADGTCKYATFESSNHACCPI
jgi:hypothetical protein